LTTSGTACRPLVVTPAQAGIRSGGDAANLDPGLRRNGVVVCERSKHGLALQRIRGSGESIFLHSRRSPHSYHRLLAEQAPIFNAISLIGVTNRGY
jgi:hypothetical protein